MNKVNIAIIILILGGCTSLITDYKITSYLENDYDNSEFKYATRLENIGDRKAADKIFLSLAYKGHIASLKLYATKSINSDGVAIYISDSNDGGCISKRGRIDKSYRYRKVHWAIEKLALQGDSQAANIYFSCLAGQNYYQPNWGSLKGARLSIEHAAENKNIESLLILSKYELSYLTARLNDQNFYPYKSIHKSIREPSFFLSKKWLKLAYIQLDNKQASHVPAQKFIEYSASLGKAYFIEKRDLRNTKYFYQMALNICYKYELSSSHCKKSKVALNSM